jgi:acyl-CoA synthetase (AMP-forming)/AMP-acid ligase II
MGGIFGKLRESAAKHPDRTFVQTGSHLWTYHEVLNMAQHVSELLHKRGVQKGDRVLVLCENSIEYIISYFGVLRLGAVVVPVNPLKTAESISYITNKCVPKLILTGGRASAHLERIEDPLYAGFPDILNTASFASYSDPTDVLDEFAEEDDIAVILFTSGTTADPKGVTLTHGNLLENTKAIISYLQLTSEDSVLMVLPFTYSYGNSILLTHMLCGAAIILEDSAAFPYKVLESIRQHSVTGFSIVGSYANLLLKCLKSSDKTARFFESLRYITFAGEATSKDDIFYIKETFPYIKIYVMYGQTEASARLSYLDPGLLGNKPGSIGKGLCNVELRVVNDSGMDVRPGEVGEIIARGPSIMKGYWDDTAATAEVLKNGWLYTGDYAVTDEDGYIYIKGRKTDMIKLLGHRISPMEIENVINRCGCIKECAVIESTLDRTTVIKAFIVPDSECPIEEVRSFASSKLPSYMRPQVFQVIDKLPKTESGKIMRNSLRGL